MTKLQQEGTKTKTYKNVYKKYWKTLVQDSMSEWNSEWYLIWISWNWASIWYGKYGKTSLVVYLKVLTITTAIVIEEVNEIAL